MGFFSPFNPLQTGESQAGEVSKFVTFPIKLAAVSSKMDARANGC